MASNPTSTSASGGLIESAPERRTNYSLTQLSETEQTASQLNVIFIRNTVFISGNRIIVVKVLLLFV